MPGGVPVYDHFKQPDESSYGATLLETLQRISGKSDSDEISAIAGIVIGVNSLRQRQLRGSELSPATRDEIGRLIAELYAL